MSSAPLPQDDPVRAHRRAVKLKIIAPMVLPLIGLVALCVALVVGVASGALESKQVTVLMGVVATAFIALPMAVLCIVPYFLLAALAYLSGWSYRRTGAPMRFARRLSAQLATTTEQLAPHVAQPLIRLNTSLVRWESTLRHWQHPLPVAEKEEADE